MVVATDPVDVFLVEPATRQAPLIFRAVAVPVIPAMLPQRSDGTRTTRAKHVLLRAIAIRPEIGSLAMPRASAGRFSRLNTRNWRWS